ncbi:hypothetical protein QYM36_016644 [Artemia franciscana]|uniref:SWI/SNF complex subunit SMARCC2 n=1 Tax=Artemia franciscana TaxID=6661 RepID=A0AA88H6E8_ARTSF|nr:hypothetical protein QYM36_016644 [Artemia franciscana]
MTLAPKEDGSPNIKFFEHPDIMNQFEIIKGWLSKNHKKHIQADSPKAKDLSQLTIQLLQFQEEVLNKNNPKAKMTKIPVNLFIDLRPGGASSVILAAVYKYKTDQGWKKIDLQSSSRLDRNIEMMQSVEKALVSSGHWKNPVIYFMPEVDSNLKQKATELLKKHGGSVTETKGDATHIVYPLCDPLADEYGRPVMCRNSNVLMHWYYFPDSHDSWVTCETDLDVPEWYQRNEGPHKVCANWVMDLDQYNEWMNEEDYEVDEKGNKKEHKLLMTVDDCMTASEGKKKVAVPAKRKSSPPPQSKTPAANKRKSSRAASATPTPNNPKKPRLEDEDDSTRDMDDPQPEPNVREVDLSKVPSVALNKKESELQPIKGGTMADLDEEMEENAPASVPPAPASVKAPSPVPATLGEVQAKPNDDTSKDTATEQTHHIVVPSYSAWFDYNSIHAIERRALPEFFNGKNKSKTPEGYVAYRNFMIDSYRLNPTEYLTSTACRRNLAGDVCAIVRVHAFLEQWGLINYQVDIDTRPAPLGPPPTSHFHVISDTPSGLVPLQKQAQQNAAKQLLDLDTVAPKGGKTELGGFGLRIDQYNKKTGLTRSKPGIGQLTREWTEQETLLLLEGLELYKDDWNKVCEHVGTRTQEECILNFLKLPIEDSYFEDPELGGGISGPLGLQPIPFSQSGNPIMSTVAFLASVVDPRVASAAAKAAMEEFAKIKDEVPSILMEAHMKNVEALLAKGDTDPNAALAQMKKLEIKLRHFEELETIMDREREALEHQRQQLLQERQAFHLEQLKAAEARARQAVQMQQQQQQGPQPTVQGPLPTQAVASHHPLNVQPVLPQPIPPQTPQ